MEYKDIVLRIAEFEQKHDVNDITYRGIHLWPLLRINIAFSMLDKAFPSRLKDSKQSVSSSGWHSRIRKLLTRIGVLLNPISVYKSLQSLKVLQSQVACDVLAFTIPSNHPSIINGKYHSFYIDPILDLASESYRVQKWELLESNVPLKQPRYIEATYIHYKGLFNIALLSSWFSHRMTSIPGLISLLDAVENELNIRTEAGTIYYLARRFRELYRVYSKLLRVAKPRAVIFKNYFSIENMSLIHACKSLGIKTVDIEHGFASYHFAYTYWMKIPQGGYSTLPDVFWVWGEPWAQYITETNSDKGEFHYPLVGGHRWVGQNLEEDFLILQDADLKQKISQAEKVILVTFSMISGEENIPEHLFETMQQSPPGWLWLLRLHPLHQEPTQVESLQQQIETTRANYEMDLATDLPLPLLLKYADHHVTMYSHAVFEALGMNVPSTVLHPAAISTFDHWIDDQTFVYARSKDELLHVLRNPYPGQYRNTGQLETSRDIAMEVLDDILQTE